LDEELLLLHHLGSNVEIADGTDLSGRRYTATEGERQRCNGDRNDSRFDAHSSSTDRSASISVGTIPSWNVAHKAGMG
jgi:hypothetical protein